MMQDEKAERLRGRGVRSPSDQNTPPVRSLGKQARKRIGTHLRAMYDSVAQQPVPSRFTELIAQLDDEPSQRIAEKS